MTDNDSLLDNSRAKNESPLVSYKLLSAMVPKVRMLEKIHERKGHYSVILIEYDYGGAVQKCLQCHNGNTNSAKLWYCRRLAYF